MEIAWQHIEKIGSILFKIDLIVWKQNIHKISPFSFKEFKIDLIVWKYANGVEKC